MSKRNIILLAGAGLLLLAVLLYQVPAINNRLSWRFEVAKTYVRNVLNPVGAVPTAIPSTPRPTTVVASPTLAQVTPAVANATAVPVTPTLAPPPPQAIINSPPYEKQTANNCGPAALSMMLHLFGWTGDQ